MVGSAQTTENQVENNNKKTGEKTHEYTQKEYEEAC